MDGVFRLAIGALCGALLIVSLSPVLLETPLHWMAGAGVLVFGTSLVLAFTADDVRCATGRCLVMLGSALMLLPILGVLLLAVPVNQPSSAKTDLNPAMMTSKPVQTVAALIAFGAGTSIATLGMLLLSNYGRNRHDFADGMTKAEYLPYASGRSGHRHETMGSRASSPPRLAMAPHREDSQMPLPSQAPARSTPERTSA